MSTRRSTSLWERLSPRATDPKTRMFRAPYFSPNRRMSALFSRCSVSSVTMIHYLLSASIGRVEVIGIIDSKDKGFDELPLLIGVGGFGIGLECLDRLGLRARVCSALSHQPARGPAFSNCLTQVGDLRHQGRSTTCRPVCRF